MMPVEVKSSAECWDTVIDMYLCTYRFQMTRIDSCIVRLGHLDGVVVIVEVFDSREVDIATSLASKWT